MKEVPLKPILRLLATYWTVIATRGVNMRRPETNGNMGEALDVNISVVVAFTNAQVV